MTAVDLRSAVALAKAVLSGRHTARAATEAALSAVAARNGALNAFVSVDAVAARAAADTVDLLLQAGADLPLAGVPIAVKDTLWVRGQGATQGSRLFADFVAPADALAIGRLRRAGAVVIGKTNTSEFACKGNTTNLLYGPTRHPRDAGLTPGGSSGGSAVAVAAGMVPLALGTDAGGSSRRPPAHVGAVGFKPSLAAVPYGPGFREALQSISCLCPIANSVADVALAFAVMAARPAEVASAAARPLRIAHAPCFGMAAVVDPNIAALVAHAVTIMGQLGFAVERADPPWPEGLSEATLMPLQHAGLAALYGEVFRRTPDLFDPDIAAQIERGLCLSGADVALALIRSAEVAQALAGFFLDFDLLVGPTVPCFAWPIGQLGPAHIAGQAVTPRAHAAFTPLFNHARVPAISLPCGDGPGGLPAGLQIVAAEGQDSLLLGCAAQIERALAL